MYLRVKKLLLDIKLLYRSYEKEAEVIIYSSIVKGRYRSEYYEGTWSIGIDI